MNRIKEARIAAEMGQKQLAAYLNVAQPTISAWEAEAKTPTSANYKRLSELFGASVDYLMGMDVNEAPRKKEPPKDEDIKFALFGGNVSDETFEEVKRFAAFVREKNRGKSGAI